MAERRILRRADARLAARTGRSERGPRGRPRERQVFFGDLVDSGGALGVVFSAGSLGCVREGNAVLSTKSGLWQIGGIKVAAFCSAGAKIKGEGEGSCRCSEPNFLPSGSCLSSCWARSGERPGGDGYDAPARPAGRLR